MTKNRKKELRSRKTRVGVGSPKDRSRRKNGRVRREAMALRSGGESVAMKDALLGAEKLIGDRLTQLRTRRAQASTEISAIDNEVSILTADEAALVRELGRLDAEVKLRFDGDWARAEVA
jgi:hypothetical protein